jgi:hypothetical protein
MQINDFDYQSYFQYETVMAMNACEYENYLPISRSSSALK